MGVLEYCLYCWPSATCWLQTGYFLCGCFGCRSIGYSSLWVYWCIACIASLHVVPLVPYKLATIRLFFVAVLLIGVLAVFLSWDIIPIH